MDIEHSIKVFPIDADLQASVQALVREGWDVIPGIPPVAVYHLVRARKEQQPQQSGLGRLLIDDSLITVVPAKRDQN